MRINLLLGMLLSVVLGAARPVLAQEANAPLTTGRADVVLLPFATTVAPERYAIDARAIWLHLMGAISENGVLRVVAPGKGPAVVDPRAVVAAALQAGAAVAVYGRLEIVDTRITVELYVMDVATRRVIGPSRTLGNVFTIDQVETQMDRQLRSALTQVLPALAPGAGAAPIPPPAAGSAAAVPPAAVNVPLVIQSYGYLPPGYSIPPPTYYTQPYKPYAAYLPPTYGSSFYAPNGYSPYSNSATYLPYRGYGVDLNEMFSQSPSDIFIQNERFRH